MPDFFEQCGTETQCQAALQAARWPRGFACPNCSGAAHTRFVRGGLPYWQCGACPHQSSLVSGAIFEASKLPLTRWFLAMQLLSQSKNKVSSLKLMCQLGICYRSAWRLRHKIMPAMRLREDLRKLSGRVEIDDAYLGGEHLCGKTGRGLPNKVPIVAAVQTTKAGHPVFTCLRLQPHTTEQVPVFATQHIAPSFTVVSDGLWCFGATTLVGAQHEREVTGTGEASIKPPQFKCVNTLLGKLKTAISGTYHAFNYAKYAHRYLAELPYRLNRRFDMRSIPSRLLTARITALHSQSTGCVWLRFIAS